MFQAGIRMASTLQLFFLPKDVNKRKKDQRELEDTVFIGLQGFIPY
jgi:hypothetical protein